LPYGSGELSLADGTWYKGKFKNGVKAGRGELVRPDGTKYIGTFKRDLYHGVGELITSNGTFFKGEFKYPFIFLKKPREGLKEGIFKQTQADGSKCIGRY
jgi:hypothetical protein